MFNKLGLIVSSSYMALTIVLKGVSYYHFRAQLKKDKVEYQSGIRTRRQLKDQELEIRFGIETEDEDDEDDRIYDDNLVGTQIRGHYEGSGWHTGTIEYYNSELDKYLVLFEDESEDLIKVEDIDGVDIKFMDKPKSSQRIHKDLHLIGSQIRADYEGSGWHTGTIKYYNLELDKYCVVFEDESEDMITEEDIDGVDMYFLTKSEMSEKKVDWQIHNFGDAMDLCRYNWVFTIGNKGNNHVQLRNWRPVNAEEY